MFCPVRARAADAEPAEHGAPAADGRAHGHAAHPGARVGGPADRRPAPPGPRIGVLDRVVGLSGVQRDGVELGDQPLVVGLEVGAEVDAQVAGRRVGLGEPAREASGTRSRSGAPDSRRSAVEIGAGSESARPGRPGPGPPRRNGRRRRPRESRPVRSRPFSPMLVAITSRHRRDHERGNVLVFLSSHRRQVLLKSGFVTESTDSNQTMRPTPRPRSGYRRAVGVAGGGDAPGAPARNQSRSSRAPRHAGEPTGRTASRAGRPGSAVRAARRGPGPGTGGKPAVDQRAPEAGGSRPGRERRAAGRDVRGRPPGNRGRSDVGHPAAPVPGRRGDPGGQPGPGGRPARVRVDHRGPARRRRAAQPQVVLERHQAVRPQRVHRGRPGPPARRRCPARRPRRPGGRRRRPARRPGPGRRPRSSRAAAPAARSAAPPPRAPPRPAGTGRPSRPPRAAGCPARRPRRPVRRRSARRTGGGPAGARCR